MAAERRGEVGMSAASVVPLRGAGLCGRCGEYTPDGRVYVIEQGSAFGPRVIRCSDLAACRPAPQRNRRIRH
jgi:hypothetical protein